MRRVTKREMREDLAEEKEAAKGYKKSASRSTGVQKKTYNEMSREETHHAKELKGMMKGRTKKK